jgi:polar amino acid transport system permease protein
MNFLLETLALLTRGLLISIALAGVSLGVAAVFGLALALARVGGSPRVALVSAAYTTVIRGVPTLVLLIYVYFGIGTLVRMNSFVAAVLGLSMSYAAFLAEVFRSGIESVDSGQYDGAAALGFTRFGMFRFVVLPQAFRNVFPALCNEGISLLKDTSLASVLAVVELTQAGNLVRARTYRSFEVLTMVAGLYVIMTLLLSLMAKRAERVVSIHVARSSDRFR